MKNFLKKFLSVLVMPFKLLGTVFTAIFAVPIGIVSGIKEGLAEDKAVEKFKKDNPDISLESDEKDKKIGKSDISPKEKIKENARIIKEHLIKNYPEECRQLNYLDYMKIAIALNTSEKALIQKGNFEILVCNGEDGFKYLVGDEIKENLSLAVEEGYQKLQKLMPDNKFQDVLKNNSEVIRENINNALRDNESHTIVFDNYTFYLSAIGLNLKAKVESKEVKKEEHKPNLAIRYVEKDIDYWKQQLKSGNLESPYRIAILREFPETVTEINTDILNKIKNENLTSDDLMVMNYIHNNIDKFPEIENISQYEERLEFLNGLTFTDTLPELVAEKYALMSENADLENINQEIYDFVDEHMEEFELLKFTKQYDKIPDYIQKEVDTVVEKKYEIEDRMPYPGEEERV